MDIKDVENLAELAKIELSSEEKKEILKDMVGILEYVKQIEGVDVSDAKEALNGTHNVWREDELDKRDFSKELIVEQFPRAQDDFLKVKKIL